MRSPDASDCSNGVAVIAATCGCGAAVIVLVEILSCHKQPLHGSGELATLCSDTNTVSLQVAVTRAGSKPGALSGTHETSPGTSGSIRKIFCDPKSAAISCEPSGLKARPLRSASGHGPASILLGQKRDGGA